MNHSVKIFEITKLAQFVIFCHFHLAEGANLWTNRVMETGGYSDLSNYLIDSLHCVKLSLVTCSLLMYDSLPMGLTGVTPIPFTYRYTLKNEDGMEADILSVGARLNRLKLPSAIIIAEVAGNGSSLDGTSH